MSVVQLPTVPARRGWTDSGIVPEPIAVARRLHHAFEAACERTPNAIAVHCDGADWSYAELEARANRLAHLLRERSVDEGSRVGILLERCIDTYAAPLAAMKAGAAYVPIDPSSPAERVEFIAQDAQLSILLSDSRLAQQVCGDRERLLILDRCSEAIAGQPATPPLLDHDADDALCYIIYTSGTTGRPKGVLINHASICNFLDVCTPVYRYQPGDRVYQGMTIAFDFSIEEIWPTLKAGATIVAGPTDHRRLGPGLAEFLIQQRVTVMCCVPTLLATIDRDVPSLRLLLVGGEACPHDLVRRWSRTGRRMLNTYGPTETTVTATWTELRPDKPVTIGRPLPTYTTFILDERHVPVPAGAAGELCIGGPGVAVGYLNRPELTRAQFIPDPQDPEANARLYRTGDLCRVTGDGEIEYLGRIDGQVKIRGHRIELSEVESVLMEHAAVESALVSKLTHEGGEDLVAYVVLRQPVSAGMDALRSALHDAMRLRLPAYMVPHYVEFLDQIPMLSSGKADRTRLPRPTLPRVISHEGEHVAPATPLEDEIAEAWATAFGHGNLSVEADFFLDLGGHSLFAAGVISRLRRLPDMAQLSVADLYAHPTIRSLAEYVQSLRAKTTTARAQSVAPVRHSRGRVWRCGMAQLALIYLIMTVLAGVAVLGLHLSEHRSWPQLIAIGLVFGPAAWIAVSLVLPVLVKWTIIGRFRPGRYPLWGFTFCRWWFVRNVSAMAPLELLAGSPLLAPYLRLLGAKIGHDCHLGTGQVGTFDLLEIGDGAGIGYGVDLQPSMVEDGFLRLEPIRIGAGAFIGTNSVLMPGATVGPGAMLLEQSLVSAGQTIDHSGIYGGSPAMRRADAPQVLREMSAAPPAAAGWSPALILAFVAMLCVLELLAFVTAASGALVYVALVERFGAWSIVPAALLAGPVFVLTTCLAVALLKRLITPAPRPGIFPARSAFGLRRWASDKLMEFSLGATNSLYATLYTNPWLRALGARVGARSEISTVSHVEPALLTVGLECFVADIATIGSPTYHNGWVGLGPVELGNRCFIGNAATIPADTRLGDDTLIGVSSVPPGPLVKAGSSWLGSPAMFLPKRQESEAFDERMTFHPRPGQVAVRLAIEFVRVVLPSSLLYLMLFLVAYGMTHWPSGWPAWGLILALPSGYLGTGVLVLGIVAALKWVIVGRYRPRTEPGWSLFVRRTELITGLYESAAVPALLDFLAGTPFLPIALRSFGTRVGAGVYLDTTYLTEFDLVKIGSGAQIGSNTSLQTHLFEDRVMKMSVVRIDENTTVGPRSVVLYDSMIEHGAKLDGLSLVMKGESLPADTEWHGIPARLRS